MDTVASVPEDGEKIIEIQLERLRTFKNHPFKIRMDQEMIRLSASVEKYGIINPLIVRPIPDGVYEIISGHRRKAAAEKFGYRKVPVIIRVGIIAFILRINRSHSISEILIFPGTIFNSKIFVKTLAADTEHPAVE